MGQMFTFSGIGQAEITDRKPKLKDGFVGTVKIRRTEVIRTRQAGDKLFVEFEVVTSNDQQLHPLGAVYSWGQKLLDQNVANGSLKKFLAAVAGIPLDDKAGMAQLEQYMDNVMNTAVQYPDTQPNQLIGRLVRVETQAGKTSQEKRDFMYHTWSPA